MTSNNGYLDCKCHRHPVWGSVQQIDCALHVTRQESTNVEALSMTTSSRLACHAFFKDHVTSGEIDRRAVVGDREAHSIATALRPNFNSLISHSQANKGVDCV